MSVSNSYEHWLALKLAQGRRKFIDDHPIPFLVWREPKASEFPRATSITDRPRTDRPPQFVAFNTGVSSEQFVSAALPGSLDRARVYAVRRAAGRPFPDRVSVGRAPNCDIVIREPSVSKLHAHFLEVTPRAAELLDAKSSNGTRINGLPLGSGARTRVATGDKLTFGAVTLEWMDAEALYDLL